MKKLNLYTMTIITKMAEQFTAEELATKSHIPFSEDSAPSLEDGPSVKMSSSEGEIFTVSLKSIERMANIRDMVNGLENPEEIIPVSNTSSEILKKVIEFTNYYKDYPPYVAPDKDEPMDEICGWNLNYISIPPRALVNLISAANFLGINDLTQLTAQRIADMCKGKTTEQIREMYDIVNDLTPEDEEQIRKENEWCELNQ